VTVLFGDGAGGFSATNNLAAGLFPVAIAVGDFNRDGAADLAVANNASHNVTILLGDGTGHFRVGGNITTGLLPQSIAVGDFNLDGRLDLAVANSGSNTVTVLFGDGAGGFVAASNLAVGLAPRSVAVDDFNGDGNLDLAVVNQESNTVSVLLGDGTGRFPVAVDFAVGLSPHFVAVGDFNRDGRPDLAVANFSSNSVTVLLNTCTAATLANVSAASFSGTSLASESIAAAFGTSLATTAQMAATLPLPTELAGTTVRVRDSAGVERFAPLFFVSPGQVNYQVPAGTAAGPATITITSGQGDTTTGKALITAVAPGLFAANSSGRGVATGLVLRVKADGTQSFEPIAQLDGQNQFIPLPIDLGPASDQVFLILYGTGIRFRSSLSAVAARIDGVNAPVLFAGPAPGFAGLDQVNLVVPRGLSGRGEVDLSLIVDGQPANTVQVKIK